MENRVETERIKITKLNLEELQKTVEELTEKVFEKQIKGFSVRTVRDKIKIIIE